MDKFYKNLVNIFNLHTHNPVGGGLDDPSQTSLVKLDLASASFSLVEMMISLIIISLVISAFSPVITKKTKTSVVSQNSVSSFANLSADCENFFPNCTICIGSNRCLLCKRSFYVDEEGKCSSCSDYENAVSCTVEGPTECIPGYYPNDGECSICPVGHVCRTGKKAERCPKGKYQNQEGKERCIECDEGYFQDVEGQAECKYCKPGTWSAPGRTSDCQDKCEAGHACQNGVKTECQAGEFAPEESSTCSSCEAGTYQSARGKASCDFCEVGTYQDETGKTECKPCGNTKTTCGTGKSNVNDCIACSSQINYCKTCSCDSISNAFSCSACVGGFHTEGNTCNANFAGQEFTSSGTFNVPDGVTKVKLTLVGGGFNGTPAVNMGKGDITYTSTETVNLTGELENLKGRKVTVYVCGQKGGNGSNGSSWNASGSYCKADNGGSGGAAGYAIQTLTIGPNTTVYRVKVNEKNGTGETGTNGGTGGCTTYGAWGCNSGSGGTGGGWSMFINGTRYVIAAGGKGGKGGNCSCRFAEGTYCSGVGGAGKPGWSPSDYSIGSGGSSTDNADGSCTSNTAYVRVTWDAVSENSAGGASGKCNNVTINIPSGVSTCSVTVGDVGTASSVICGSSTWTSEDGTLQNAANGLTGGAGFGSNCSSGSYGKGGSYTGATSGYVHIGNAI